MGLLETGGQLVLPFFPSQFVIDSAARVGHELTVVVLDRNPNAACVVTLVDRLIHNSEFVPIDGESYRLKEAREKAAARARERTRGRTPQRARR